MAELISVIVTTYNREDALEAVLRSLARQTDADFEVIVADDGSEPATASVGRGLEGEGRPSGRARLASRTTVFAPRKFATARCWCRAAPTASSSTAIALCGRISSRSIAGSPSRARSSPATAFCCRASSPRRCWRDRLSPEIWSFGRWIGERLRGGVNRLSALLRLPLGPLRAAASDEWQGARSCNLAIWRSDLDRVDGFDADYSGWGKEDSDLIVRLLHAGVRRKDGVFATGVIHLWHAEADRSQLNDNERKLAVRRRRSRARATRSVGAPAGASPRARRVERWRASRTLFDRQSWRADWLEVAVAVSLPWSTSATSILLVLWLVASSRR